MLWKLIFSLIFSSELSRDLYKYFPENTCKDKLLLRYIICWFILNTLSNTNWWVDQHFCLNRDAFRFSLLFYVVLSKDVMVSSVFVIISPSSESTYCPMVDNTGSAANYQLIFISRNEKIIDASHWHLMCKAGMYKYRIRGSAFAMKGKFCEKWETYLWKMHIRQYSKKCCVQNRRSFNRINFNQPEDLHSFWEMQQKNLRSKISKEQINVDVEELYCLYNRTHINIAMNSINALTLSEIHL